MLLSPVISIICLVTVCTDAITSSNSSHIKNGNWSTPISSSQEWQTYMIRNNNRQNETRSARTVDVLSNVLSKITSLGLDSKPAMMSPPKATMAAAPPIQSGFKPSSYDSSGTAYYTPSSNNNIDQRYAMAPSRPMTSGSYSSSYSNDKTYGDVLYGSSDPYGSNSNYGADYGSNQYSNYPQYAPTYPSYGGMGMHKGYQYPTPQQPGYDLGIPPKDDFEGIKDFLFKLLALVPVGLLLSAIIPSLVVIPPVKRSTSSFEMEDEDDDNKSFLEKRVQELSPILDVIEWYGPQSFTDSNCMKNVVCYIAREGRKDNANFIQKGMWLLTNRLDPKTAEKLKVTDLREAILDDKCLEYKCGRKSKNEDKP